MREQLKRAAAAVAERHRPLQAIAAASAIAAGVGWVYGPGWALIVVGGALLVDVVADGIVEGIRRGRRGPR